MLMTSTMCQAWHLLILQVLVHLTSNRGTPMAPSFGRWLAISCITPLQLRTHAKLPSPFFWTQATHTSLTSGEYCIFPGYPSRLPVYCLSDDLSMFGLHGCMCVCSKQSGLWQYMQIRLSLFSTLGPIWSFWSDLYTCFMLLAFPPPSVDRVHLFTVMLNDTCKLSSHHCTTHANLYHKAPLHLAV